MKKEDGKKKIKWPKILRNRKAVFIIIIISIVVLGGLTYGLYYYFIKEPAISQKTTSNTPRPPGNYTPRPPPNITKENLPSYLQKQQLIKDLPDNAIIELSLYNFNTGVREWEESYVIKKASVVMGTVDNPDFTIIIHSRYVPQLGRGFCSTVKKAKANNDLGFETEMSMTKLLWKYRSVMDYKDCFGL